MKNKAAQMLGRMARGVPKNYTPEERMRRSNRMKAMNATRGQLRKAGVRDDSRPQTSSEA